MKRRSFLKSSFILSSSVLIPENFLYNNKPNLKVGIIADVHQDIIFDGTKRIKKFLKDANKLNVDLKSYEFAILEKHGLIIKSNTVLSVIVEEVKNKK